MKNREFLWVMYKRLGTGFDEESSCNNWDKTRINNVIMAASFKDVALLEQTVGRSFRAKNPHIDHFVDSDKTINGHWLIHQRWYKSLGGSIEIVKMVEDGG